MSCHSCGSPQASARRRARRTAPFKIALVGSPNVGKSVLFNALTGTYVTVSNYPGTTVEVSRGRWREGTREREVVDSPGMYSLLPITEEEKVARRLLLREKPDRVVHVVDAKNLERLLPLTLQLSEAGLPLVLDVNIIDEAERIGLALDTEALERRLGIPVVATSGISGRGIGELKRRIEEAPHGSLQNGRPPAAPVTSPAPFSYDAPIESAIEKVEGLLSGEYNLSKRAIALLALQEDPEILDLVSERDPSALAVLNQSIRELKVRYAQPLTFVVALCRQAEAHRIAGAVLRTCKEEKPGFGERLSRIMVHPLTGIPILLAVLYFGLYQFVGVLGAGVLVNFLENRLFERLVNPFLIGLFDRLVPWPVIRDLFVGEYGVLTLGLRYAVALILPIVGTFFIAFSIMEDSGYFPRLALLVDRVFKRIGLSGRAVIPMVLGLGCDTMATMVTRTLETRREKVLATLLLALAIPCSAQLGVILAVLSSNPLALLVWALVIGAVFLLVGALSARLLPGSRPSFYMELPPLRLPKLSNVLVKTYTRMRWYLLEVLPFFLLASVLIWIGRITGFFPLLIRVLKPVVGWLGLPQEAAVVFVFGFFRRDYGAAGLYDLRQSGLISGRQLVVASVTLTLFIPCIAQLAVMIKERGWKTALGISAFILPFSFLMGFLVNWVLAAVGAPL